MQVEIQKNVGNQRGDAQNQGGKLSIAVEMKQESNGDDKFKEGREVKITQNEYISKNLVLHIWFRKIYFQFHFGHTSYNAFLFLLLNLDRQIRFGNAKQNGKSACLSYLIFYFLFLDLHYSGWCFFSIFQFTEAAIGGVLQKKGILQNFANFTGKHLCWRLFLLTRDSNTGAFM